MSQADIKFLVAAGSPNLFPKRDFPEIAFAGRSNVGKSSLINSLVGHKSVAKVSATPGRTQTINFYLVNSNWVFVDLPGYGYARVPLPVKAGWKDLIEEYLGTRQELQAVVLIVDLRREPMESDLSLYEGLMDVSIPVILVATKADKLSKQNMDRQLAALATAFALEKKVIVKYSAEDQTGHQELWKRIREIMAAGAAEMKSLRQELAGSPATGAVNT